MYYEIEDDLSTRGGWAIGINDEFVDALIALRQGQRLSNVLASVPIEVDGHGPALMAIGFHTVPVCRLDIAKAIEAFAPQDVQVLHAALSNGERGYMALNLINKLDLADVRGIRRNTDLNVPDALRLRLPANFNHHFFRLRRTPVLIVSQPMKDLIQSFGDGQLSFVAVPSEQT